MALTQITDKGIKDGEIVNADVNASAAIAGSKLAASTTSVAGSMSAADKTKLDGVAASANNYTHPNHSGEVTSTADGATVIASDIVDEDNLKISNAGSNGQFLQKQSGNTGGLTWATVSASDATKMPLAGGTFTGDVVFDNSSHAGYDMTWDESDKQLEFADDTRISVGNGNDLLIFHNATDTKVESATGALKITSNDLKLKSYNDEDDYITCAHEGAVSLYYHNAKKLETTNTGVRFGDNVNIELGTDNDLQLYHSGSHGTLNCSTGFMHILGAYVRINSPGGDKMIEAIADNTVNIMYDNAIKINTTSSGCTVTGSVSETSDAALKNNIQQLTNSLSNIKQLKGYSYEFKDTGVKSIGCTTQDVEKVYPDLVEGEEGNKTLQYSGLIGPLIEAVKELSTEVETLKTKVAALEAG